jgi:hypothetical protein
MKKLYDTKLVEIDKTGYGPNDIVKSASGTVLVAEKSRSDGGIYGWQAQRLVITSNEPVGFGWYIDDCNLIRKSVTDDADYWAVRKTYKRVEATYPSMPEISMIAIADVIKWVKEGCSVSVDLAVNSTIRYPVESHCLGSKPNGVFVYTPILINNTVKMVWAEPFVDERQYLKEEREYNETGYREEEEQTERPQQVAGVNKTYEERLNDIAEEMAKSKIPEKATWVLQLTYSERDALTNIYKPLAAIALKHMAEAYTEGCSTILLDKDEIQRNLFLMGLTPQTT